ncbi:lipoate--protein ligase [Tissierella pigra]|uniref:lipoate--protein ligase n=1 Tax=Tissierella pigra TaxID=2607614 RepID=A0A6N7XM08_9FIRM|nr:lipoate--protein ligase [Tissierella pigra]MBU5427268.1 lipoate--protein ligase [Tissierella pigra]MSU02576.1 lipoate--protein ligase [Tissierella pigra]
MKYLVNNSNDPRYNLAFEEYCFKSLDLKEDYVILWINGPAIIVGKNQNTIEEVNQDYVDENGIKVVRRVTGGGAVYHDLGNLNFSIISMSTGAEKIDFKKYNIPIVKSLEKLGINCELSGRNDITIDEKKFSGIAQSVWKQRVLNHGTLLFDTELDVLSKALNVKQDKIESKGVKSVKSRVTNIKPYLEEDIDIFKFRDVLLKNIFAMEGLEPEEYKLSQEDLDNIQKLFEEKYSTWEWNYGESPKSNYKNYKRFPFGSIDIRFNVVNGLIEEIKIYGDFFGTEDVKLLEDKLNKVRYDKKEVQNVIKDQPLQKYFGNISEEEFINLMFQ